MTPTTSRADPSPARPKPLLPAWTATLTWKAAVFITVMCCALAALLGALVHVSVANQTVGQARDRALGRLDEATEAYEAGARLGPLAGVDPLACPTRCAGSPRAEIAAPW